MIERVYASARKQPSDFAWHIAGAFATDSVLVCGIASPTGAAVARPIGARVTLEQGVTAATDASSR